MSDTQLPKALQLAENVVSSWAHGKPPEWAIQTAAELRRLHAELEQARAILALRPAQAGVQHFGWAYDFLDGVRIINDWVTSSKDEAFKPGHFNQRELLAAAPNE